MTLWLLVLASLPAVVHLLRARKANHVAFFSAGYLYYWILPVIIGQFPSNLVGNDTAYASWASLFTGLPRNGLVLYSTSILAYYLCFRLGDKLAQRKAWKPRSATAHALNFVPLLYVGLFVLAIGFVYHIRSAIGANYGDIEDVFTARGNLTAISLVLLALALLKTVGNEKSTFYATVSNRWMLGYFLIAFLLLAMGERLYFLTSIMLLVGYRSVFFKEYKASQLVGFVVGMAALAGAAGLIRLRTDFSANAFILDLAGEPVFTSFSLISFLQFNHIPWIAFPRYLMGDFLNLVPTAFWANKVAFLPDPTVKFFFVSPLGALDSWVSFIINFGLIGTAACMLFFGYILRWLLARAGSAVVKTQYLMFSAFMTFTFFRDPFSVSLVKNIFEFSLVTPVVCALLSQGMVWSSEPGWEDGRARIQPDPQC